jgi:hypothetical protein
MNELTTAQTDRLVQLWRDGAAIPLPIVPQLAGLEFWYLPSPGDAPGALLFMARFHHDAEGGTAADYVALNKALPVDQILEQQITPVGEKARGALATYLKEHYAIHLET